MSKIRIGSVRPATSRKGITPGEWESDRCHAEVEGSFKWKILMKGIDMGGRPHRGKLV